MITKMYSIRDNKASVYGSPFCVVNELVAKRLVADMLQENRNMQSRHPEDFDLYEIASFDDASAVIKPCEAKFIIGLASLMPPVEK